MMKAWVGVTLLAIAVVLAGWLHKSGEYRHRQATNLPWQIEKTAEGRSRVFGIELGTTKLKQAFQQQQTASEIALFSTEGEALRLEVYFGKLTLGPFQAHIIASLSAPEIELKAFAERSYESEARPSGRIKMQLVADDLERAKNLPVSGISYRPTVDLDTVTLEKLFGKPNAVTDLTGDVRFWSYPERGVILMVNEDGKEVFHYFHPGNYRQVISRLGRVQAVMP